MFYRSVLILFFFFFSSRRRHTRYIGDWSSDVCSSDLAFVRINGVRPIQNATRSVPASLAERLSIRPLSDRAAHAVGAATAVAIARAAGQKRRPGLIDVGGAVRISRPRDSVRVAKTAGLHFVRCSNQRSRRRAAGPKILDLHFLFRTL